MVGKRCWVYVGNDLGNMLNVRWKGHIESVESIIYCPSRHQFTNYHYNFSIFSISQLIPTAWTEWYQHRMRTPRPCRRQRISAGNDSEALQHHKSFPASGWSVGSVDLVRLDAALLSANYHFFLLAFFTQLLHTWSSSSSWHCGTQDL